jgi:branched-subunit amino acid ABC-type transport system permease component
MSAVVAAVGFGLVTAAVLALAAVGFTLQFGVTNILNLAYGDVMTASVFAAYGVTLMGGGLPLALCTGAVAGAVLSLLLNRCLYMPFLRRGTELFGMIIVTISAALIIQYAFLAALGPIFFRLPVGAGEVVRLGAMTFTTTELLIMGMAVVAMAGIHLVLRYTRIGKAMRATAGDPALARSCGIPTGRVIDLAWLASGALCGLAGVSLAITLATFTAGTGSAFLVPIIAAAVLGGIGQPYGAMLGALTVGIVSEVSAVYISPQYKSVAAFIILILVLVIRPHGIFAEVSASRGLAA